MQPSLSSIVNSETAHPQSPDWLRRPALTTASAQPAQVNTGLTPKIVLSDVNFFYCTTQALLKVSIAVPAKQVTAFIGPSGCGKSTLLRCLNRLNDLIEGARIEGKILLDGLDIYSPLVDVTDLRKRVGMVFQRSNPFPKPIYDNAAYGPRLQGIRNRAELDAIV